MHAVSFEVEPEPERRRTELDWTQIHLAVLNRKRRRDLRSSFRPSSGERTEHQPRDASIGGADPPGGDQSIHQLVIALDPAGKSADRLQLGVERDRAGAGN